MSIFGMPLEVFLINLGNVLFFIANLPQTITAFKNRKDLRGLSFYYLLGLFIGTIAFAIGNYLINAIIASGFCVVSLVFYVLMMYWKAKYVLRAWLDRREGERQVYLMLGCRNKKEFEALKKRVEKNKDKHDKFEKEMNKLFENSGEIGEREA